MKLGAYQFVMTGDLARNLDHIKQGIQQAASQGVELLAFPECALTGYPPLFIPSPSQVDTSAITQAYHELQDLAVVHHMHLVIGTILQEEDHIFNSALLFSPDGTRNAYHKRALWGWDADHFNAGTLPGVWDIAGLRVGVRICYEVRFPEYFRELYKAETDLNLLLFCDVADTDDIARYNLIRGHIQTRAVENVCPILAINTLSSFQTAPTGFYDASGRPLAELPREEAGLLVVDWLPQPLSFGECGRRTISDQLIGIKRPSDIPSNADMLRHLSIKESDIEAAED